MKRKVKIYTYSQEEVALFKHDMDRYPGYQRIDWMPREPYAEVVLSPVEADFIISPVALHCFTSKIIRHRSLDQEVTLSVKKLPYWGKYKEKHVFIDITELETSLIGSNAIMVRSNLTDWIKEDGRCIPWFWPVENLEPFSNLPKGGFKYDVSFHGWLSTDCRKESVNSCITVFEQRCDAKTYETFFGYLPQEHPDTKLMRTHFLESLHHSKIILSPQSRPGVFPYRFFEALSMGRVPALFCTGYNLPFSREIDWEKCALLFPAEKANSAGQLIKEFLDHISEQRFLEMCSYARKIWMEWLNRDNSSKLVTYVLEQILNGNYQFPAPKSGAQILLEKLFSTRLCNFLGPKASRYLFSGELFKQGRG